MGWNDLHEVMGSITELLDDGSGFLHAVREVKAEWRAWQGAGSSAGATPTGWGASTPALAREIRDVAVAHGDAWVPATTAGLGGTDLTGVWCPPMNVFDQCTIRQSGAYLNVAVRIGAMTAFAGEGLFDPRSRALAFAGRYANGAPAEVRAQLLTNGCLGGMLTVLQPWGVPMANPLFLQRLG